MLVLLLAYSLTQGAFSEAGPIPASLERRDVASCSGQGSQRTIYGIVWSCLSTIFLCTWVSLHPNIAFRREKLRVTWSEWIWDPLYHILSYKLPLFLWALIFPEYILLWAVRQYVQAGAFKEKVPGWTRTHGFFVIMGGFHLFRMPIGAESVQLPLDHFPECPFMLYTPSGHHFREDDVPIWPLLMCDLPQGVFRFLSPTEAELKDKGKGDGLTKLIVIVQTLWFVSQCIIRGVQRLHITELEVVTLGYVILNFSIYLFWWDKPRNVKCPIRVYQSSTRISGYWNGQRMAAGKWFTTPVVRQIQQLLVYCIGMQDHYVDMSKRSSIPMFWSDRPGPHNVLEASIGPSILGAAFGAIHFIAWSYEFPSYTQFVLWRISCLAMTGAPLFASFLWTTFRIWRQLAIPGTDPLWLDLSDRHIGISIYYSTFPSPVGI